MKDHRINSDNRSLNTELKEKVLKLLETYPQAQRQIQILRYEMEHCSVSAEDVISEMAFARGDGDGKSPSQISNRTLYIALNYRERLEDYQSETSEGIAAQLWQLEREQERLNHFVSLLNKREAEVIRLYYFEQNTWDSVSQKMNLTPRRVQGIRKAAVEALCEMYTVVANLK